MQAERQKIQLKLAFGKRSEGEARSGACEGTEVCVARVDTEQLGGFHQRKSIKSPRTDPYAWWCGRGNFRTTGSRIFLVFSLPLLVSGNVIYNFPCSDDEKRRLAGLKWKNVDSVPRLSTFLGI
ncbi:MAG: hypothetical protein F4X32_04635 [Candidatus Dadabacteria bacterium]|nr:hypothetical protein [Candidatus Dadabacteria bacterium]